MAKIFVFDSDIMGFHKTGNALIAVHYYNAVHKQSFGLSKLSYAIPIYAQAANNVYVLLPKKRIKKNMQIFNQYLIGKNIVNSFDNPTYFFNEFHGIVKTSDIVDFFSPLLEHVFYLNFPCRYLFIILQEELSKKSINKLNIKFLFYHLYKNGWKKKELIEKIPQITIHISVYILDTLKKQFLREKRKYMKDKFKVIQNTEIA